MSEINEVRLALATRMDYNPAILFPLAFPPPTFEETSRAVDEQMSGPSEFESTISADEALAFLNSMNLDTGSLGPDDLRMLDGNHDPTDSGTERST